MSFTFRPARRENTPLIVGVAGPTKSGKTMSSHRLAVGMARGGKVVMINTEGARGHCYADQLSYVACDLEPPYRPEQYTAALKAVEAEQPAVVIIDSVSHMHDGPGGILEMHEENMDRMAGNDFKKRERYTWAAWKEPKRQENAFIYQLLSIDVPVIMCMRAKEKIKIVKGGDPIDLGWQPIVGERVAFETMFTLMLPPHSRGTPDLSQSDMRTPFDTMVKAGRQIDESLGEQLADWATGGVPDAPRANGAAHEDKRPEPPPPTAHARNITFKEFIELCRKHKVNIGGVLSSKWSESFAADVGASMATLPPMDLAQALGEWANQLRA